VCHNNRTDLDAFEEKTREEWDQFLKSTGKMSFVMLPPNLDIIIIRN
jgi:hypothetical protein